MTHLVLLPEHVLREAAAELDAQVRVASGLARDVDEEGRSGAAHLAAGLAGDVCAQSSVWGPVSGHEMACAGAPAHR